MKLLQPRLKDSIIELADGTRTIEEVAALTGYSEETVRVTLYRARREGLDLPMRRKQSMTKRQREDYKFVSERLLEGWTMAQIARYMKRDEKQLTRYFEILRGNV